MGADPAASAKRRSAVELLHRVLGHSLVGLVAGVVIAASSIGCGSGDLSRFADGEDGGSSTGTQTSGRVPVLGSNGGWTGPCTGLECQIHACLSGTTTIHGTIYDPAGRNPLYNVAAYIPNTEPGPLPYGASCASCDSLYTGDPIATAISDASGHFTIHNAPDGENIPLVIQVGKWRKQFVIPKVAECGDTTLPDRSLTLPRNSKEGDIPMIAISTGGSDTLECLLSRVGLDASEYSPGATGPGHIQIYQGGTYGVVPNTSPPGPQSYQALWDSPADLMRYDIVLLSCEGEETTNMNQSALLDYTAAGGRVFASHYHYAWFNTGPYAAEDLASWTTGTNDMWTIESDIQTKLPDGKAFPKGLAMQDWLGNVGALQDGQLPIVEAMHNANVGLDNPLSTPWIVGSPKADPPNATEYFSFDTPLGAPPAEVCGRVVYSDLHVGAASHDNKNLPVPSDCAPGALSPQEDALEFMLFDLSSCVTPNADPPRAPQPIK
jgi:hypothetical protein